MWDLRVCTQSCLASQKRRRRSLSKRKGNRKGQASSSSSLCSLGRIFSSFLFCGIASGANPLLPGDEILRGFSPAREFIVMKGMRAISQYTYYMFSPGQTRPTQLEYFINCCGSVSSQNCGSCWSCCVGGSSLSEYNKAVYLLYTTCLGVINSLSTQPVSA